MVTASSRREWWWWFLPVLAVLVAWAFATPLFAPPDEGAHVLRAVAIAHGEFTGKTVFTPIGSLGEVSVPTTYREMSTASACFTAHRDITPQCVPDVPESSVETSALTIAAKYPPLFYLVLAPAVRAFGAQTSIYGMRLIACVVSAAFFAMAFTSAQALGRLAVFGVAAAVTPTALSLSSVVNPNGVEIAAATALWIAAAAIARAPMLDVREIRRTAIAYVCFANMRTLSLLLAIAAVVLPLALASRDRLLSLAREQAARAWGALMALASVLAAVWIVGPGRVPRGASRAYISFVHSLTRSWRLFEESVAWFGLLEVRVRIAVAVWLLLWALLVLRGVRCGDTRARVVLGVLFFASLALPIVVSMLRPPPIYGTWLGRYSVPMWIGMPILSGAIASTVPRVTRPGARAAARARVRPIVYALAVVCVLGHVVAFATAAHRYAVGSSGRLLYIVQAKWSAPLPHVVLLVLAIVATAALAARAVRCDVHQPAPVPTPSV
jgi:Predicted membrane protein (DUF2142)